VYVLSAAWMLFEGFKKSPTLLIWVGLVALLGLGAFVATRRAQRRPA
jgi:LPXTG-motif cell wall-anchored protein